MTLIRRAEPRTRLVATRVTERERDRWHRIARQAGLPVAEFVREAARHYARILERDCARDDEVTPP